MPRDAATLIGLAADVHGGGDAHPGASILVRMANASTPPRRRAAQQRVRPGVRQVLDSITGAALVATSTIDAMIIQRRSYGRRQNYLGSPA
jgi:hypothetical protein